MLAFLLIILLAIIFLFFVGFSLKDNKRSKNKIEIAEVNPSLMTADFDQHVRRLNKFRTSNYKGITYYFSKKGGLYYYSKDDVRIYM